MTQHPSRAPTHRSTRAKIQAAWIFPVRIRTPLTPYHILSGVLAKTIRLTDVRDRLGAVRAATHRGAAACDIVAWYEGSICDPHAIGIVASCAGGLLEMEKPREERQTRHEGLHRFYSEVR